MKPLVRIERLQKAPTTDVWFGSARVLRLTRRRTKMIYGRVTALYAHRDGRSVLKSEAPGLRRLPLLCGVMVCTERGTAMLQWRGWSV